jgi:hypothetical protein
MIRDERAPTLDDVLNEFVAEHERPTSEALEMWAGRYPQFRREGQSHPQQLGEKTITSLTGDAKNAGMSVADFAKGCGLDLALMAKLNNRQISPETIPSRLVSHIARLVGRTVDGVMEYLGGPPQLLSEVSFMSKKKPRRFERQSFADAVRASSLSKAEKARWLDEATGKKER